MRGATRSTLPRSSTWTLVLASLVLAGCGTFPPSSDAVAPAESSDLADQRVGISDALPRAGDFLSRDAQRLSTRAEARAMTLPIMVTGDGVSVGPNAAGEPTRIVVEEPGVYNIQFVAQLANDGDTAEIAEIWLRVDGADVPATNSSIAVLPGETGIRLASWNFMRRMAAGSYAEVMWSASSTDVHLEPRGTPNEYSVRVSVAGVSPE